MDVSLIEVLTQVEANEQNRVANSDDDVLSVQSCSSVRTRATNKRNNNAEGGGPGPIRRRRGRGRVRGTGSPITERAPRPHPLPAAENEETPKTGEQQPPPPKREHSPPPEKDTKFHMDKP